ncbi:hypothetical protein PCASD_12714 [Puccinia coronata f. sp. avenae]|uniref:Uncharacterized protein n=1 Tax=Puccinia coronata f. sp. avenae TaxID=200324 RepID=A0A2N5UCN4_9BASI|nr:hypothetical protein PCASD_18964 [Puccinia coronata f. sp. avenae]PLW35489.1 hypothetical protein PCASD_12714 [Puccinia coronata f. sp. avenae]
MVHHLQSWADENFHHHSSTNLEEKQNNWTNTPHYSASKVPSFPLVVLSWSSGVICLTKSLSEDKLSTGEPKLVADQPTVAAAAHNLINPYAWTPIAAGPRLPVPPEYRIPPEHRNLKPPPKRKQPAC